MTTPKEQSNPVAEVSEVFVCPDNNGKYRATVLSDERLSMGAELFVQPPTCNAVAAVALTTVAAWYQKEGWLKDEEDVPAAILALIPADHMQVLRELITLSVAKGIEIGLSSSARDEDAIDALEKETVDRILTEKGLV
jgi:hypothetical protein